MNSTDPPIIILRAFLEQLKVRHTKTGSKRIADHQDYPSFSAFSDFLNSYGINTICIKITDEQLSSIPLPCIAHSTEVDNEFIVLKKIGAENIIYFDKSQKEKDIDRSSFCNMWTGYVLLAEANGEAIEENFNHNKTAELANSLKRLFLAVTVSLVVLIPTTLGVLNQYSTYWFVLLIINVIGVGVAVLLVSFSLQGSNAFNHWCNFNPKLNCKNTLNSTLGRGIGILSLAELGLIYFIYALACTLISAFLSIEANAPLFYWSYFTIPFSMISVFVQWKNGKWCLLCLISMGCLWSQAIVFTILRPDVQVSIQSTLLHLFVFSTVMFVWLLSREGVINTGRLATYQALVKTFKNSWSVFRQLLNEQKPIAIQLPGNALTLGLQNETNDITLISNPDCEPCAVAHVTIDKLLVNSPVRIDVILQTDDQHQDTVGYRVAKHFVKMSLVDGTKLKHAMALWFTTRNPELLLNSFPIQRKTAEDLLDQDAAKILKDHANWCKKAGYERTPTIILKGKKLPDHYSLGDVWNHRSKLFTSSGVIQP